MASVRTTKRLDPTALKDALGGVDVLTSGGDIRTDEAKDVIANVDEATLQAAIDGYTPPPSRAERLAELRTKAEALPQDNPARPLLLGLIDLT